MAMNGLTSLLWFIAIVALIPLALWLLKRTPMGGAGGQGVMRSVAALPLSASQRIVTVEVGQGEVVVVNDKFGIRLTDIITPSERIRKLNK